MLMKKFCLSLCVFLVAVVAFKAAAQRQKLAIFAPLYLDTAFTYSGDYRFGKSFPKMLNPGVEFYQGVKLALDSLEQRGAPLEVFIYDSKSRTRPITQLMRNPEMADVGMMIAFTNPGETRQLADIAKAKKIPFVSATLPNDAGVSNNPYFVILNTTLMGHIEGIYRLLQQQNSKDRIILFSKSGQQEDAIRTHFTEYGRATATAPLNIKVVDIGDNFTSQQLAAHLDSTKRNVVVSGSMDEDFGIELAKGLTNLSKTYPTTLVGMPTWENYNFNKAEFKSLDIVYSTPFYYARLTPLESRVAVGFEKEIGSRPTDVFFRGFETTVRFAQLLLDTKKDAASNLTQKGHQVFTRFDIQPVFKDKRTMTLDYFENKNLYFVRVNGGYKKLM
jgi:ABC-type branched-subunit amino acid transport system substrate-binding protein